ncbi:MAG: GntR family transcriptional regulator [Prevotella sp.]|nr:GntR family transcriptional regulator [Prevotella sp.]
MKKILLGQKNRLKAAWKVDFGMYLEGDDEGKILLPARYVPEDLEVGDEIDVFVYLDNEERRVATTLEPKAMVGDFAYLEVAWVNEFGAFLDWGLMKDLFCPFREQKKRMEVGRSYIVHVHLDEESYRIMASAKVEKWLENDKLAKEYIPSAEKEDTILSQREKGDLSTPPLGEVGRGLLLPGSKVSALIWQKTDLGFKAIIDNKYGALLYDSQVFKDIHTGDRVEAYITKIRPDGKIDIALQPSGRQHTEDFAEKLLHYLQYRGGRCRLGDKSSAEEIKVQFGVSKKTYKRAIGDLYKRRLITISEDGIELV